MILRSMCLVTVLFTAAACSSGGGNCNASLCASGCCDSAGVCQTPSDMNCGNSGGACTMCGPGLSCVSGKCTPGSGNGGGASGDGGGSAGTGGGSAANGGGVQVGCQPACGSGEVCSNQVCKAVPAHCPCPVETYCDLSSNACVVGCTSDTQCSTGRICDSTARMCHDGCRQDDQCANGQICQNDACVTGCRSDGACGAGQICQNNACVTGCRADSACTVSGQICQSNACVAGCRNDGQCGSGRICANNGCRAGCRSDSQCGAGGVCQMSTLTCKTGCDQDSQCPKEQLCNVQQLQCAPGCNTDQGCNAGRICMGGQCRDGCRQDGDCPLDNYCDNGADGGLTCKTGCGAPTMTNEGGNPDRCNLGEACVPYGYCEQVLDAWCTHACTKGCNGWACTTSATQMYTCFEGDNDYAEAACRLPCQSDSQCPGGQVCNKFTFDSQAPANGEVFYCSSKCTSDTDCASAVDGTINSGKCQCGADGLCHENGSAWSCIIMKPNVLLP